MRSAVMVASASAERSAASVAFAAAIDPRWRSARSCWYCALASHAAQAQTSAPIHTGNQRCRAVGSTTRTGRLDIMPMPTSHSPTTVGIDPLRAAPATSREMPASRAIRAMVDTSTAASPPIHSKVAPLR